MQPVQDVSRRGFVAGIGAMGAAAVAATAIPAFATEPTTQSETSTDIFYTSELTAQIGVLQDPAATERADVVVAGSGIGGLSAAIMAKELMPDATVILLEKASIVGGLTRWTNCPFGEATSFPVNMTPEEAKAAAEQKAQESSNGCKKGLYYNMYREWGDTSAWLVGKQGVEVEHIPALYGGDNIVYKGGYANTMLDTLVANAEALGVDIRLDSRATALVTADSHTVTGVQYLDADGNYVQIDAPAVILGTGCVSANPELIQKLYSIDPDEYANFGLRDDTGDGQVMVQATAHGRIRQISYAWKDFSLGTGFYDALPSSDLLGITLGREPTNLHVNEHGVRTHDESVWGPRALLHDAHTFSVFGSYAIDQYVNNGIMMGVNLATVDYTGNPIPMNDLIDQYADAAWLFKADTVEGLGEAIRASYPTFDVDAFMQQVADYDSYAANGVDEQWGKDGALLWPIGDGPYYAAQVLPMMLHAGGGVEVNTDLQVVDPQGEPIVGVYAIGNTGGPWSGESYLTGAGQNTALWGAIRAVHHAVRTIFGTEVPVDWMGEFDNASYQIPEAEFPESVKHAEVDTATGRYV